MIERAEASPNPARPGDVVTIRVTVRQLAGDRVLMAVGSDQPPGGVNWSPPSQQMDYDEAAIFIGTFTMPNWGLALNVYSYYWAPGYWAQSPSYDWVEGYWVQSPNGGYDWVEGYWVQSSKYDWVEGYWVQQDYALVNIGILEEEDISRIESPTGSTKAKTIVQDYAIVGEAIPVQVIVTNTSERRIYVSVQSGISYDSELFYFTDAKVLYPGSYTPIWYLNMPDVTPTVEKPNRFVQIATYIWVWDAVWDGHQWITSNPRLDFMAIGRQVRIMPPSPEFSLKIKNVPSTAFVWLFQYMYGGVVHQSGTLVPASTWYSPYPSPGSEVSFEVFVWDNEGNPIHHKTGMATIGTGSYNYNCATGIVEVPGTPEITVSLEPGESKAVSFEAIPHQAKTYTVKVDGLTGTFVAR